jgi:hypothetical protein
MFAKLLKPPANTSNMKSGQFPVISRTQLYPDFGVRLFYDEALR